MITKQDIREFLVRENEQKLAEAKELYSLNRDMRIRKRKCIADLQWDKDYKDTENRANAIKFDFVVNLSDFKIGDYIILSHDNPNFPFANGVILEIGNTHLVLSIYKSDVKQFNVGDITADIDSFDSTDIYNSFWTESDDEKLDKWLDVINEAPSIEYNEIGYLNENIEKISQRLGVKLTGSQHEAIYRAIANMEYYLIQGPPGTGKTFVIAIIAYLLLIYGNNVLICSSNHLAVNNVLCRLHKGMAQINDINPKESRKEDEEYNTLDLPVYKIGQSYNTTGLQYEWRNAIIRPYNFDRPNTHVLNNDEDIPKHVIGLVPYHLFTSKARGLKGDVLIIDEAGQMTIPTALMAMQAVDYVILVGDHKQLSPIFSYKDHPATLQKSIFQALYRDYNCTTLDTTYRMNDNICSLVSEAFYDGKLNSANATSIRYKEDSDDPILNNCSVVFKHIQHDGDCTSEEEAIYVTESIKSLIENRVCSVSEIAVMAPFRAQCALIRRKLNKIFDEIPIVDTIDRMQGQEREIIFISFTAGNKEYTEELADFLYTPNKVNVAVSRAKTKLVIVGNRECIIRNVKGKSDFEEVYRLITNPIVVNY